MLTVLPWPEALAAENRLQIRHGLVVALVLALLGLALHWGTPAAWLYAGALAVGAGFWGLSFRLARPWFTMVVLHVVQVGIIAADRFEQATYPSVVNELGFWMIAASLCVLSRPAALWFYGTGALWAGLSLLSLRPAPDWLGFNLGQVAVAAATSYAVSRFQHRRRVEFHRQHGELAAQAEVLAEARRRNLVLQAGLRWGLTDRETEVLQLVADGLGNADAADRLFVSVDTVKKHLSHIFRKSGAKGRFQLVRWVETGSDAAERITDR